MNEAAGTSGCIFSTCSCVGAAGGLVLLVPVLLGRAEVTFVNLWVRI